MLYFFNSTWSATQQSFNPLIFIDINREVRLIYLEMCGNLFINLDIQQLFAFEFE